MPVKRWFPLHFDPTTTYLKIWALSLYLSYHYLMPAKKTRKIAAALFRKNRQFTNQQINKHKADFTRPCSNIVKDPISDF